MATEIVSWCDVCLLDDERVHAAPLRVALDGKAPRALDLCDEHRKTYVEPLRELLSEHGTAVDDKRVPSRAYRRRQPAEPSPAGAPVARKGKPPAHKRLWPCLWCSLDYAGESSLTKHVMNEHGLKGLRGSFGTQCPACADDSFRSLGAHTSREHPELGPNVAAVFAALRETDPHGVVAERVAAGSNVTS